MIGESLEEVTHTYREIMARDGDSLDEVLEAVTPADARARVSQALASTPTDAEQSGDWEQWPMLRPFVDFVVGLMPEGGTGYDENDVPVFPAVPRCRPPSSRRGFLRTAPIWSRSSGPPRTPPTWSGARNWRIWPRI